MNFKKLSIVNCTVFEFTVDKNGAVVYKKQ